MVKNIEQIPSPHEIYCFQVICEQKNLTRASERLGMTQPSLSLLIKRVEQKMNTPLLIRDRKGVCPTKPGLALLKKSDKLLAYWQEIHLDIEGHHREMMGQLSLGAHPAVASYTYSYFIRDFYATYPKITLRFKEGLSREICEEVISQELDLGLVINPVAHPDLIIKKICPDNVCFWKSRKTTIFNNLEKGPTLIYNPSLVQSQELLNQVKKRFVFTRTMAIDSLSTISQLVASSSGIGILPSRVVGNLKNEKSVIRIDELPQYRDQLALIYHVNHRSITSIKESANYITDKLKENLN